MTTNFSYHGMVWGEMSSTGVVTSYGHDALGSVTETYQNGTLQNTYRYKPYGGLLAKTGTAPDPSFLWNGGRSGYRATNLPNSDYYVRRRHYSSGSGKWTTADPLWPQELPFVYVRNRPTFGSDPSGMRLAAVAYSDANYVWSADMRFNYNSYTNWTGYVSGDGWIIQYVNITITGQFCGGQPNSETYFYWEAWRIKDGVVKNSCNDIKTLGPGREVPWMDRWSQTADIAAHTTATWYSNAISVAGGDAGPTSDFLANFGCNQNDKAHDLIATKLNVMWAGAFNFWGKWVNNVQKLNYSADCCKTPPDPPTFNRTPSGSPTLTRDCH